LFEFGLPAGGRLEGRSCLFEAQKVTAMRLGIGNTKAQSLLEYAMVAAIVTAAVVAMSTYVFRSVQASQQTILNEFTSN